MIVGGYSLHLYCEHPEAQQYICTDTPGQFVGYTKAEAYRRAKQAGWTIRRGPTHTLTVLCPRHSGTSGPSGSSK